MKNLTEILPLLTGEEIAESVKAIITPENADAEARELIRVIYAVANFEDAAQANLANEAIKVAYRKTTHFHCAAVKALDEFIRESINPVSIDSKTGKSGEPALIG